MRGMKLTNEYARALTEYARLPKAVLAAVAYSFAARVIADNDPAVVEAAILLEWQTLYENGIVPQAPGQSGGRI